MAKPVRVPTVRSAQEIVEDKARTHRDKMAKKVEATAEKLATGMANRITRDGIQAMMDSATKAAGLDYRLIATTREFGLLRKRVAENAPDDFPKFLRYTLTYWPVLSQQNHAAVRKDESRIVLQRRLPPAPHFSTLVYWYPYFLKAYRNHIAGQQTVAAQNTTTVAVDRLRKDLEQAKAKIDFLVRKPRIVPPRQVTSTQPIEPTTRRTPTPDGASVDIESPAEFRDWDEK